MFWVFFFDMCNTFRENLWFFFQNAIKNFNSCIKHSLQSLFRCPQRWEVSLCLVRKLKEVQWLHKNLMCLWSFARVCSCQRPNFVWFCSTQESNKVEPQGVHLGRLGFITVWSPEKSPWEDRESEKKKVKHNLRFLKKAKWGGREEDEVGEERGSSRRRVWGRASWESWNSSKSPAVPSGQVNLWVDNPSVRTLSVSSLRKQNKKLSLLPPVLGPVEPQASWIISFGSTEPTSPFTWKKNCFPLIQSHPILNSFHDKPSFRG